MPTLGTVLIRHIAARHAGKFPHIFRIKVTVMTRRADIMRPQRIYFSDSCHGRYKRRSNRTSGSYQIAVIIGLPHQLLSDNIHNGKSITNDRLQFSLQTLGYHLRQIISVDLMSFVVTDLTQRLVRIWNDRRALIRTHR